MRTRLGPFSDHPRLDEIAHRMFREFSRMEYGLKAVGHLKRKGRDGPAEADWDSFAHAIDRAFGQRLSANPDLQSAVEYIRTHPPKKQIVRDGVLGWSGIPPTSDSETGILLKYVGRVRNNLFHGGKFNGHWIDPERSEQLLLRCLVVLNACLLASPDVREAYEH